MTKKVQIAAITPATGPAKRSRAPKTTLNLSGGPFYGKEQAF